jgi:PDZ domain-containing protein
MNARKTAFTAAVVLVLGVTVCAQDGRPYIGVRLDPTPLPELLTKHLGLDPEQGIRIRNVNVGSPADVVGLERDDIIIRFQSEDVKDLERFVETVGTAGVGREVALEIIHLGQPKTLEFSLAPFEGGSQWKYPPEPEAVTTWRPGKVFRVAPDGEDWVEIHVDEIPDTSTEVKRFFNQLYTYRHSTDGEDYVIGIEGDPRDASARITVHAGDTEHATTAGQLDTLPEKYREPVREALEHAQKSSRGRVRIKPFALPQPPKPDAYRRFFQDLTIPRPPVESWSRKREEVLERLQEQMGRLQQRMEELEQRHQETLKRFFEKREGRPDEDDASDDMEAPVPEDKPTI